jgi:hypothetical protein
MNQPDTWPPLRWKLLLLAFWIAVAIFFVVVFTFWPNLAQSMVFRVSSFVAIIAVALALFRRPKTRD